MQIKAGYGYWETTRHPIGGEFHRAGADGEVILDIVKTLNPPVRGCDVLCSLPNGRSCACDSDYLTD